mmetsp:Transcript_11881/g.32951  ORF Transcript_11881/g.32951 Transcript_11881/m.32951 type:complete len:84 (+) Transcript_11881:203-454(+)
MIANQHESLLYGFLSTLSHERRVYDVKSQKLNFWQARIPSCQRIVQKHVDTSPPDDLGGGFLPLTTRLVTVRLTVTPSSSVLV